MIYYRIANEGLRGGNNFFLLATCKFTGFDQNCKENDKTTEESGSGCSPGTLMGNLLISAGKHKN